MEKKIIKVRVGQCFNMKTREVKFQLQFKAEGEHRYDGFSIDVFDTEAEAKGALNLHNEGKAVYTAFATLGGMSSYFLCKVQ